MKSSHILTYKVSSQKHTEVRQMADAFTFREDLGYHWLQRACLWILMRIGAHQKVTHIHYSYKRVQIESDRLVNYLVKQVYGVRAMLDTRRHLCVLMGPDEFHEIWGEVYECGDLLRFELEAAVGRNGEREIMGMKISIIPWMKGVLVVPAEVLN